MWKDGHYYSVIFGDCHQVPLDMFELLINSNFPVLTVWYMYVSLMQAGQGLAE